MCDIGERRCIEAQSARCITSSSVCNGVPDCSDGSDEFNCTGICYKIKNKKNPVELQDVVLWTTN